MNTNPSRPAFFPDSANEKVVNKLNIYFALGFLMYLTLFAWIFKAEHLPLFILIVATAALNVGALVGFLYSTFDEEEQKFSQIFVAVNGVIGGATLTDLMRTDNSLIIKGFKIITVSCGLQEQHGGLVLLVIAACAPVGFFWLYFNRKLVLNPEISLASKRIQEANDVLNKKPLKVITDPDTEKPTPDPEVKAAAKVITQNAAIGDSGSVGTLVNTGRSFYELQNYPKAIEFFKKALAIRPNQPDTLLVTASAMLAVGNSMDASGILEKLTSLSVVPTGTWKLLGYAYLFYPDNMPDKREILLKSIEASKKFIAFDPEDAGAKLNLACAYGQLGPDYPEAKGNVFSLLKEVLGKNPEEKARIQSLTQKGQDFERWTEISEFMRLIS